MATLTDDEKVNLAMKGLKDMERTLKSLKATIAKDTASKVRHTIAKGKSSKVVAKATPVAIISSRTAAASVESSMLDDVPDAMFD